MVHLLEALRKKSRPIRFSVVITFFFAIAAADYQTGIPFLLAPLYLIPIVAATWITCSWLAIGMLIASSVLALFLESQTHTSQEVSYHALLNVGVRIAMFGVVSNFVARIRTVFDSEALLSRTDELTGALNRRFMTEILDREIERARRHNYVFSLAYIDLNKFKFVNDNYGHLAGDKVLQTVVQTLRSKVRTLDLVARMGGDEFLILLPHTDANGANLSISRLANEVEKAMQALNYPITLSCGIATSSAENVTLVGLLDQADSKMYAAKAKYKGEMDHASETLLSSWAR
ncbi:MAG: GGDEF domain-containing protein [Proteobacteria bacterium]|nr:MAG: GGDEF domain-containing protein [Pseudomonadota bacterium]